LLGEEITFLYNYKDEFKPFICKCAVCKANLIEKQKTSEISNSIKSLQINTPISVADSAADVSETTSSAPLSRSTSDQTTTMVSQYSIPTPS